MQVTTHLLSLPDLDEARVVVPAPTPVRATGPVPRARVVDGDLVYLAYRVRRPLADGRGVSTVVARSPTASTSRPSARCAARRLRCGVVRATGRAADTRRRLAPLRLLRDPRQQALVDRGARRRPPEDLRDRSAHGRPPRLRHGRRQGPRDRRRRRRRLARLDLRAPARPRRVTRTGCPRRTTAATTAWSGSDAAPSWRRGRRLGRAGARVSDVRRPRPARRAVRRPARARRTTGTRRPAWRGPRSGDPARCLVDDAEPLRSPYSDGACRYAALGDDARRHAALLPRAGAARRRARPGHVTV